jgi:hypothetical protein
MPLQRTQPDGVVVNFFQSGDLAYSWLHSEDNFTIESDPKTNFFCWAIHTEDGQDIKSSGYPIHLYDPVDLGLQPNIHPPREVLRERAREIRQLFWGEPKGSTRSEVNLEFVYSPTSGNINQM